MTKCVAASSNEQTCQVNLILITK